MTFAVVHCKPGKNHQAAEPRLLLVLPFFGDGTVRSVVREPPALFVSGVDCPRGSGAHDPWPWRCLEMEEKNSWER